MPNKLSKFTPLQTTQLRGTAAPRRPLARRYLCTFISLVVTLALLGCAQSSGDEVSEKIREWSEIMKNELPNDLLDYEVVEWGNERGLEFSLAGKPSSPVHEYELVAKIGTYRSIGIECKYYSVFARVPLNQYKQATGFSVGRDISCADGK